MTLPIDNATLLGDFVPNVYISRIMLSYGTQTTTVRGDSPHYDIPTKEQYLTSIGMTKENIEKGFGQTLTEEAYKGLYGTEKKKTGISTYSNDDPGKNNKTLTVRVDLVVKDVIENKFLSNWFNEEKLKKYINLFIVQSTDVESTALLDSIDPAVNFAWYSLTSIPGKTSLRTINLGDIYPSNGEGETSPGHQMGSTKIQYDPNRFNSYEYSTNDLGQRVYNITFSTTFTVEKPNVNHLAYFAVANVDKKFFEDSFEPSIDIGNVPDLYKHLTGKKAFEFVIKNGKTITDAYYYIDRDNKVWLGDIHFMYRLGEDTGELVSAEEISSLRADQLANMVGIPMKGKTQAEGLTLVEDEEDLFLTEVKATNTTIQDFRQRDLVDKLDIDFSEANKLFSTKDITEEKFKNQKIADGTAFHTDFWASRDINNRLNFCFGIDMRGLLVKYSQYSKLWENLSKRNKHFWISDFFKSMSIVRKRVEAIDNTDVFDENIPIEKIATLGDKFPKTGFITKLTIELGDVDGYEYCFFSGYDETMRDISDGFYQYGIEFSFEDILKKLIVEKIRSLEKSLRLAKQLYTISVQPQYYNLISDTYTKLYKEQQTDEYFGIVPDLLAKFNQMYSLVTNTNSIKKEGFIENLINISSPKTGTPDGLEFVINMVEEFLEKVMSIFSLKSISAISDSGTNAYNPSGVKSSKQVTFLDGEAYFGEIFDASMRNSGYEYLSRGIQIKPPDSKLGIRRLSYLDFEERTTAENLKYFTDETPTVPIKLYYQNKEVQFESNLIEDKYTFLSPSSVKLPESGKAITLPFIAPENSTVFQSSPVFIQYDALNNFYLEIIKKFLIGQDSGVVLDKNDTTKSQKTLLTGILAAKGLSFGLAATEGIPAKEALTQQLLENDEATALAVIPQLELDEVKPIEPVIKEEPNYNDALFFMTDADNKEEKINFFKQFPTFLNALRGHGFLPLNESDLEGIPNHFKQLILLDPSPEATGIDTSYIKDNLRFFDKNVASIDDLATNKNNFGIFINYFNLVQIEYLAGFIFNNIKGPYWSKLTPETFSNIKSNDKPVLCRLRYYTNEKLGVTRDSAVDLPIYDQYFILASMKDLTHIPNYKGGDELIKDYNKMSKHKKTMDDIDPELLISGGPSPTKKTDKKTKQNSQNPSFGGTSPESQGPTQSPSGFDSGNQGGSGPGGFY